MGFTLSNSRLYKKVRNFIRPYYLLMFKSRSYIEKDVKYRMRDWNVDISLPENEKADALESILLGKLNYRHTSEYKTAVLFAMPKSASLFTIQLLASSLNYMNHQIGFNEGSGEIYYPRMVLAATAHSNTISHCHSQPYSNVVQIIDNFNIKPIVLYRNLPDVIASRKDMLVKDKGAKDFLPQEAISNFLNSSEDDQLQVTIDLFADQYINFYQSWVEQKERLSPLFIRYEDVVEDKNKVVQQVAYKLGETVSSETVEEVSNNINSLGGINFNKGIKYRGENLLKNHHLEVLSKKAKMFNCKDEEFLGLSHNGN